MSGIAAVILCGGQGTRLGGVDKARLEIGGRRLIDRALEAVRGCAPVLLATGGNAPIARPGTISIADLDTGYAGPLAGVAAAVEALAAAEAGLLFSLAVDTPCFPADFLARALPLLATAPAVLAAFGAQDYPTNALWRLDAIASLPAGMRAGRAPHSLRRLAAGLGAARLDYAPLLPADPFRNVNTPADLALFTMLEAAKSAG